MAKVINCTDMEVKTLIAECNMLNAKFGLIPYDEYKERRASICADADDIWNYLPRPSEAVWDKFNEAYEKLFKV